LAGTNGEEEVGKYVGRRATLYSVRQTIHRLDEENGPRGVPRCHCLRYYYSSTCDLRLIMVVSSYRSLISVANSCRIQSSCSLAESTLSCYHSIAYSPNYMSPRPEYLYCRGDAKIICNRRCRRSIIVIHQQRPVSSLVFGRPVQTISHQRPWHDPEFMDQSSPEDVENWFISLIKSTTQLADEKGIITTNSSNNYSSNLPIYFDECFEIDSRAYLRLLESYTRTTAGGSSGNSQKSEYWIGVMERHYAASVELFYATYGGQQSMQQPQSLQLLDNGETAFASLAKRNKAKAESAKNDTTSINSKNQRELAATIVRNLQPTVECYNSVIEVWSNDKDLISVVRSRRWLSKLEDEARKNTNDDILRSPLFPNARSYDLYLKSCSRGIGKQSTLHKERAEEAEEILQYRLSVNAPLTIRPTTESFNYVCRAWTRCRKDISVASKVMNLVLLMERIQKEFVVTEENGLNVEEQELSWKRYVSPDTKTYTMALDGWIIKAGIVAEKWRSDRVRVLKSIQNANRQRGREKSGGGDQFTAELTNNATIGTQQDDDGSNEMDSAYAILQYIHDLDRIGHADVHATVIAYNTLLSGWARLANEYRANIPLKSEKILHDMIALAEQGIINAAPDVTSFNAVIKAWGRTKQPNSTLRCEYWLRRMIREGGTNFIAKPDVTTYNLCMDAHLNVGDAPRVEDLLIEMDSMSDDDNNVSPNSESYSKVIRAWLDDEMNGNQYGYPGASLMNAFNWLNKLLDCEKSGDDHVLLGPAPELFSAILKTAARTVRILPTSFILMCRVSLII